MVYQPAHPPLAARAPSAHSTTMIDALRSGAKRPRMVALAVLACAMLLRLLVPAGWMPVADANGVHLTPCSGTGPMTMPMASGQTMAGTAHHMPSDQQGAPEHPCAFGHLSLAIAEPEWPALILPITPATLVPAGLAALVSIGRGLAAPPPPPTGPPAIA